MTDYYNPLEKPQPPAQSFPDFVGEINDRQKFGAPEFLSSDYDTRDQPKLTWPNDVAKQASLEAQIDQLSALWANQYSHQSSKAAITIKIELEILQKLQRSKELEVFNDILLPIENSLAIPYDQNGLISADTSRDEVELFMDYYDCVERALDNITSKLGYTKDYFTYGFSYMRPPTGI